MEQKRRSLSTFLALVPFSLALCLAAPATAALPCVQFDADETIACYPVESDSDVRLVSATFRVTSILRFGEEDSIEQLLFAIENPQRNLLVVDYSPQSQLSTKYAGNINVERSSERSLSAGADVGIKPNDIVRADASASSGEKTLSTRRFELIAPQQQVSASGTIHRGAGVYFKFKPSSQTMFEGAREFKVVFRVPKNWRGDIVTLTCAGYQVSGTKPVCGSAKFRVGLHMVDDTAAKTALSEHIRLTRDLVDIATRQKQQIKRHQYPSLGHKLGAAFSVVDPKIPNGWLKQVFASGTGAENLSFKRHLPLDIQQMVSRYADSTRQVTNLVGATQL